MQTHYRFITLAAIAALPGDNDYDRLARFSAVNIAPIGEDAVVLHVFGEDRAELPGAFLTDDLAEMDPALAPHVLHARWEQRDEDDPGYGPEALIPPGVVVLETGINPHSFAI